MNIHLGSTSPSRGKWLLYSILEKISRIVKNSHEFAFIRTGFVHAFGILIHCQLSCSISHYMYKMESCHIRAIGAEHS